MKQNDSALLVEVLMHGARVEGYCNQVGPRYRLSEVLNTPGDALELENALTRVGATEPMRTASITIEKKAIVAAIPWETNAQNQRRALATSVTGRAVTTQLPVVVLSPPFVIAGTAHMPGGYGTRSLQAGPGLFTHFFSVTGASVTLEDGSILDAPVVLVNREVVAAMAASVEHGALRLVA